jgi:hypothetical protein
MRGKKRNCSIYAISPSEIISGTQLSQTHEYMYLLKASRKIAGSNPDEVIEYFQFT